ncbi:hypothetical protein KCMC57_up37990 [Kitasatospora sp. CMC57]|uniref:DUF7144 domain-containing protein n=1 Tax=Kitasatospora sp. CMC57 TaxID=3231513 RepID=A0AB33K4L1_9ACTN
MTQAPGPLHEPSAPVPVSGGGRRNTAAVTGLVVFAGVMMLVDGLLGIFQGIVAIARDDLYLTTPNYVFRFNLTTWGWIHLAMGALLALIGYGVLRGAAWGRVIGIALVALNLVLNFLFLPYYPLWSLAALAMNAFVLWALCTYRD